MNAANLARIQALALCMTQRMALLRTAGALKAWVRLGAVVGVMLSAGCAGVEPEPRHDASPQAKSMATPVPVEPKLAAPMPPTQETTARAGTADKAAQPSVVPSVSPPAQGAGKAAATPSKVPARSPVAPPAAAPSSKGETPTVALPKPQAAAPLDLKSLETRLKETQAIGVFTKLTLKSQIDELLGQFRAFYQGKLKTSLADLRRSYDMLVLKVLALLQDADPPLASAIAGSREAIWGILSNPAKFAAV